MSRSLYARLARRFRPRPTDVSRREFLKLSLAAGAGLLMSCGPTLRSGRHAPATGRRVAVVGAGFAGLACAHELLAARCDVSVLEARSRVGGRVLTFRDFVAGKTVEGGAELIGSNHPAWLAYARRFGLTFLDVTEEDDLEQPIVLGGKRLNKKEAEGLFEELDAAYGGMARDAAPIDADEPWNSPRAAELDARSAADWLNALKISPLAKLAIAAEMSNDNGAALARQSYLGNLTQVKGGGLEKFWTESEVYRCRGGNDQLARKLAGAIGGERLRLGVPVTRITVKSNVTVERADGVTLEMDDVVLAVPPSVWGKIVFEPELPPALQPQMGTNVKFLTAVKERFWKARGLSPNALTDGIAGVTWEGTDNQRGPGAALTVFAGGPAAEACRVRGAAAGDTLRAELEKLYPGFAESFISARFMDWPADAWTLAGYSFPAPGQVTSVGPLLQRGAGRLHFAGEHACYKFVGYMEGALQSGANVARRLLLQQEPGAAGQVAGPASDILTRLELP